MERSKNLVLSGAGKGFKNIQKQLFLNFPVFCDMIGIRKGRNDHMKNKRIIRRFAFGVLTPIWANMPLIIYALYTKRLLGKSSLSSLSFLIVLCLTVLISWCWCNIVPYKDKNSPGIRFTIMRGGVTLGWCSLYGFAFQLVFYLAFCPVLLRGSEKLPAFSVGILTANGVYGLAVCFILLWNGILRIFFTSARLRLRTRVLMLLAMWIPVVNILVLIHAMNLVRAEYDFACYKDSVRNVRTQSDLCRTKYPLVMVHGVGFRDLKYFNYWGRIPKELTRYGATVYYGNQEALGTIAYNAEDIRKKILEVVRETGCEKVNIIAHSKGGLDSRYAITKLGMHKYVATLTTVSTPHHGCRFVDKAVRLPEGLYRLVAKYFDRTFQRFGDKNPDFYTATHQFSTEESKKFNEAVPDCPEVCYQSYASVMRDCLSDPLLWLPYCFIKPLEGDNDGLVSIESAKWGEFRTVFKSRGHRGISHGDMIDLKREDYQGFDVVECYVQIVSDLVKKGF